MTGNLTSLRVHLILTLQLSDILAHCIIRVWLNKKFLPYFLPSTHPRDHTSSNSNALELDTEVHARARFYGTLS